MHACMQLRGYAVSQEPSIETENQGYATFCDANADDPGQVVVEHEKLYVESFIATAISLVALVFFTFLAAPILIYQRYDKIYTYAKQKSGNLQNHYLIWSIVTLCTAADYILGFLGLAYHYLCWSVPHFVISPTVDMFYLLVIVGCVVIALLNLPIAITVVLKSKKNDFPVPDLIRYITCHCRCCPCAGKENIKNYLIQILAVFHVLIALQISCVHTVFVFLAFIARPLPTAMTIIFYAATMFCLATTIMLLYASCDFKKEKRNFKESFTLTCSGIIQTFVFICFLFALIFFGITFLRITVFVGDTESGRISSMVGSLLPTLLIAIFGFGAKELLIDDNTKEEGNHDNDKVQDQNQNIES